MIALGAGGAAAAQPPRRIVSLNLCTDQLLLALAPERIVALSQLAADPLLSVMAAEARRYPRVGADAEEVLRYNPDLIVAAPFAARATVDLLRRLGRRVLVTETGQDVEGLQRTLRQLGGAIGARDKADAIIAGLDAQLAAHRVTLPNPVEALRPAALILNFGGLPSGPGSLADAALRLAGYANAAAAYPADPRGAIPLEAIVARPPDLLVLGQDPGDYATVQADNLRHPALRALLARVPSVHLPQRLTLCATPHLTQAVALLAAAQPKVRALRPARAP